MDDNSIIELYFNRDEQAIEETKAAYGHLIYSVAYRILESEADSEECENDTYLRAWNNIPPTRPGCFSAFLSKISRNLALNLLRDRSRRRPLGTVLILDEIAESVPDGEGDVSVDIELRDALNDFLSLLQKDRRRIFMKRYFYMSDVKSIAREMRMGVSNVKVILWRTRNELRVFLESRGIVI